MNLKTFRECVEGGQLFSSSLSGGDVAGISPTTYVLHTLNSKLFKGEGWVWDVQEGVVKC